MRHVLFLLAAIPLRNGAILFLCLTIVYVETIHLAHPVAIRREDEHLDHTAVREDDHEDQGEHSRVEIDEDPDEEHPHDDDSHDTSPQPHIHREEMEDALAAAGLV